METQSVLVEYKHKQNGKIYCNSGFLFDDKYIIITPNILIPLLNNKNTVQKYFTATNEGLLNPNILLKSTPRLNIVIDKSVNNNKLIMYKEAEIIAMFIDERIKISSSKILRDWTIDCEETEYQLKELLSLFFILEIDKTGPTDYNQLKIFLQKMLFYISPFQIETGNKVCVESTPFGNRNFLKSFSRGIVSNIIGENSSLILTDTPTAPGSEGSPIYIESKSSGRIPIGIVISCLSWWKGEWIGLTLGANLIKLIEAIITPKTDIYLMNKPNNLDKNGVIATLWKSIVQVVSGSSWGTAIFFHHSGLFVTNSHVIENDRPDLYWNNIKIESNVIFKSAENGTFDLAVLQANPIQMVNVKMKPAEISLKTVEWGEKVFAVGYPLFARHLQPNPTITQGHISQVDSHMLKTTCSILPGASGGAILRADGSLIGVIVCNTRMETHSTAYPRINMSIPITAIYGPISKFIKTSDKSVLKTLDITDSTISNKWNITRAKL